MQNDRDVRLSSSDGKWLLFITILGSSIALLDSTAVNIALPALGKTFDAEISGIQWVISGYLITLSSLILIGGSFGDIYGRLKIFTIGIAIFGGSSVVCAIAPNIEVLIAARVVQGIGGALMTPASLALIQANFHQDDRAKAIGAWAGLTGIAAAIGPFVGGWLTESLSWRWVFILNIPLVLFLLVAAPKKVANTRDESHPRKPDVIGGITTAIALGSISYALIEGPRFGMSGPIIASIIMVAISMFAFFAWELRTKDPMVPLALFRSMQFSGANAVTLVVYAALSGTLFLLILQLQESLGYSPKEAGLALVPLTILLLLLSPRSAALSARIGPRMQMTVGPLVIGASLLGLSQVSAGDSYWTNVFPYVLLFGLGLSAMVAPLTVTVLAAAPTNQSGIASGINNAIARAAGLLAVAALPFVVGLKGSDYSNAVELTQGFHDGMIVCSVLCFLGGLFAWITIRNSIQSN